MELPERNFGFLLHDVARLMRKRFEQNARGLRLTRSQCSVLAHLARNEGIPGGISSGAAIAAALEIGITVAERKQPILRAQALDAGAITSSRAAVDCKLMHCLPVRRNVAVADEVLDGRRSVVQREAYNRLVVQTAILHRLLSTPQH